MMYEVQKDYRGNKPTYSVQERDTFYFGNFNTQYDTITIDGDMIGHWVVVNASSREEAEKMAMDIFTDDSWYDEMGRVSLLKPSHKQTQNFMDVCKGKI